MKTVLMYEAEDGKQFYREAECQEYEQQCADVASANDMLKNGATLMQALIRANQTRPWWLNGMLAEDKEILTKLTKDTRLVVCHWQYSDEPGYAPCAINLSGQVYLHGDVGHWTGPYGKWLSLRDVLRCARKPASERKEAGA